MSELQSTHRTSRAYRYEKDEEYKILRLLFGRVIIFAKRMPKIKVIAIAVSAAVLFMVATGIISIGYAATAGGKYIGTVISADELYPAVCAARESLKDENAVLCNMYPRIIFMKKRTGFPELFENLMLADGRAQRGAQLQVGEKTVFFPSHQSMLAAIYEYILPYTNENTVSARLDDSVKTSDGVFLSDRFISVNDAVALLKQSSVAVETTEKVTGTQKLERPVQSVEDSTKPSGEKTVKSEGNDGAMEISKLVTKRNGAVVNEYIIDENVITLPVAKVESVGTKVVGGQATGNFLRPVSGRITSLFGTRWGKNHDGIDYAGNTGDGIKASDGGTVIFSGLCEGYGKLVIIDHENGFETYYGHLNAIYVSSGEKVSAGKIIGEVGNSGNSTGPHLHFEIRKNGIPKNPNDYLAK